jgi:hypothetical protein
MTVLFILILSCGRRMDNAKLHPIMKKLSAKNQLFNINPNKKNIIKGKKGTRLIIPEKAFDLDYDDFKKDEKVTVKLIEITNSFDIASSGMELTYINEDGDDEIFESAGMLNVSAEYKKEDLELDDDKKIKVHFPNILPGEKFNVYQLNNDGRWELDGHNQTMAKKEIMKYSKGKASPKKTKFDIPANKSVNKKWQKAAKKISNLKKKIRIYSISRLTWWNFDYPEISFAAVTGSINNAKGVLYQAFIIGLNRMISRSGWFEDGSYSFNFLRNTRAMMFIIAEDGRVGFSRIFNTGERRGDIRKQASLHNHFHKVKNITLKKVPDEILMNRRKILKYIGIIK